MMIIIGGHAKLLKIKGSVNHDFRLLTVSTSVLVVLVISITSDFYLSQFDGITKENHCKTKQSCDSQV